MTTQTTKTQTMVKINKENSISILNYNTGSTEIAHIENKELSYKLMNDVISTNKVGYKLDETIEELASQILMEELKNLNFKVRPECEAQIEVTCYTYTIWITAKLVGEKIVWELSTIHELCEEEDKDKNFVARTTFKGLVNYLERFNG